jgi:hypothetical protein
MNHGSGPDSAVPVHRLCRPRRSSRAAPLGPRPRTRPPSSNRYSAFSVTALKTAQHRMQRANSKHSGGSVFMHRSDFRASSARRPGSRLQLPYSNVLPTLLRVVCRTGSSRQDCPIQSILSLMKCLQMCPNSSALDNSTSAKEEHFSRDH